MTRKTPVTTDPDRAAEVLGNGGLVAFPTETVYGLGADAASSSAVSAVFEAKGRPADHPLIVHIGTLDALETLTAERDPRVERLAAEFWPGPLTVIVARGAGVCEAAVGGRDSVGVRMPDHPLALAMLAAFHRSGGGGVVGPSANRFGRVSPTTAAHVLIDLGGRIDLVLDGGPCRVGVESTIVELLGPRPTLLRPGAISAAALASVLGGEILDDRRGPSRAAGMMESHYAPGARVVLIEDPDEARRRAAEGRRRLIGPGAAAFGGVDLGPDSAGFAAGLYAALRQADRPYDGHPVEEIVVVPPTSGDLVDAVRDRLEKAAAPRPE